MMARQSDSRRIRRVIDKSKRGIHTIIFSRLGLILLLLLLQFLLLFSLFRWFASFIPHMFGSSMVFNLLMIIVLINSRTDPSAKLTWLIVIMVMPVFGSLLYLYTRSDLGHRALMRRVRHLTQKTRFDIRQKPEAIEHLEQMDPGAAAMCRYTARCGCHPLWENTEVTYFPSGEKKLEALLQVLEQANKFIFLEYFIIDEGTMWGQILDVLAEKVKEGVEVRVIIDGACEFMTLPHDYPERLSSLGIRCKMFAPAKPFVSTHYNYRDHRKIAIVDGQYGFTGGVNLADEYINERERFGHWKDTAIMLDGPAVRSLTLMFLQMWGIDGDELNTARYIRQTAVRQNPGHGFVLPYGDSPLDDHQVGERVYLDMLYRAKKYVHIMTPYLILDSQMENALKYAAERGVDVHLILPGIPDKKYAWWLAHTYYPSLVEVGVKISEYQPGFVHAKVFVIDDKEAVVGTINLDYRSLYHHFECAVWLYQAGCISDIEQDFQNTLAKCTRMTQKRIEGFPWYQKIAGAAMKALAPLM